MSIPKTKTTIGKVCEVCAEEFYIYPSGASKGRFCSRKCWVAYSALPPVEAYAPGTRKAYADPKEEHQAKRARSKTLRKYRKRKAEGVCTQCTEPTQEGLTVCTMHARESVLKAQNLRLETLDAYGAKCVCCSETEEEFLQVDHVDGWGKYHRDSKGRKIVGGALYAWAKKNNYPISLRLLCASCHASVTKYGTCAHVRKGKGIDVVKEQPKYVN